MKNHIFDNFFDSINFYFILGVPNNILSVDFKILDESEKNVEVPRLSIFEKNPLKNEDFKCILFCDKINLKQREKNEIKLKLTYQELTFTLNEPIKFYNDDMDIFYCKNIDFPIYKKRFFSFGQREAPKLLQFTKNELFEYFIQ